MMPRYMLLMFAIGLAVAWLIIPAIIRHSTRFRSIREHSFHHTHTGPIPRLGGLALAVAFLVLVAASYLLLEIPPDRLRLNLGMAGTALAMFGLGFWDDLRPLGARKKLLGQILIAAVATGFLPTIQTLMNPLTGVVLNLGVWGVGLTIFWLVAFTNLINLVDGIDGLAGGLALMLMGLLAYVGASSGGFLPVCVAAGMAGALVAFLRFNFPPARIYLGDGGAYFLGFLIGALAIIQSQKGAVVAALIAPLFALALPIIDTCVAVVRRALKGLPVFRPDRRHVHHKLVAAGFTRRQAVLLLYAFSVVCLLMAFGVYWSHGRWAPIFLGLVTLLVLVAATRLSFARVWLSPAYLFGGTMAVRKASQYALVLGQWLELEAERSPSLDALWQDYEFMVRKIGFQRVRLEADGVQRLWESPTAPPTPLAQQCVMPLNHATHKKMTFWADADRMPDRVFDQVSELAAEAWVKAVIRLQKSQANRSAGSSWWPNGNRGKSGV